MIRRSRTRVELGPYAVIDDARHPGRWYVVHASTGHVLGPWHHRMLEALNAATALLRA